MEKIQKIQVSEKFQKQLKNFLHIAVAIAPLLFHISSSTPFLKFRIYIMYQKIHAQSEFKSCLLLNSSEILEKLPEHSWPQFIYKVDIKNYLTELLGGNM